MKSRKLLIALVALPAWGFLVYLAATHFYCDSKLEPNVRHLYECDDFAMHELFDTEGFNNFGFWPEVLPTESIPEAMRQGSSPELYRQVMKRAPVNPSETILEVGCGRGGGALLIAQELQPKEIIALDFCQTQLKAAKKLTRNIDSITFVEGHSADLPCSAASVNKVLTVGAAQHFSDIGAFTTEAYRVLKPGGQLIVSTFFGIKQTAEPRLKQLIPTFKKGIDRCNDLGDYLLTLQRTGFTEVHVVSIGDRVFPGFDAYMAQEGAGGFDWNRNWYRAYESGLIDFVIIVATKSDQVASSLSGQ